MFTRTPKRVYFLPSLSNWNTYTVTNSYSNSDTASISARGVTTKLNIISVPFAVAKLVF
jgi:hypothetical protein